MTYSVNGRQYIIVGVSGGNYTGELRTFSVANAHKPVELPPAATIDFPPLDIAAQQIAKVIAAARR